MSTNPAGDTLINHAWKIMPLYAQNVQYSRRRSSGVIERILALQAAAGPNGDKFRLLQVRDALNAQGLAKKGKEVVIQYRERSQYGAGSFDPNEACVNAPSTSWKAKSFYLDKTATNAVELDLNLWQCTNVDEQRLGADMLAEAVEELTSIFSNDVEQLIYKEHIGSLPSKIGGIGQIPRPYSQIAVFGANGKELNESAQGEIMTDMLMANIGRHVILTAGLGMRYANQKRATLVNDRGTDFTAESMQYLTQAEFMHTPVLAGVVDPASYGTTGSPALVLENGAIYIASAPYFKQADNAAIPQLAMEPGVKRYSIAHPYLPGIFIDVVETVKTDCETFHSHPKVKIQMAINYTVISRMSCEVDNGNFSKGVNGVFLYFFTCADTGACDYADYKYTPPFLSKPLDNTCNLDITCAAELACKVTAMGVGFQEVNGSVFAVFAADVKPSGGASNPASYAWLLNGAPYITTTSPTLLIDITDLADGDVVSLVYEDTLECAQTVDFSPLDLEAQGLCGVLVAVFDGSEIQNGDTLNLGSYVKNAVASIDIKLSAVSFEVPVTITGVTGAVDGAALALPVTPVGIESNEILVTLDTAVEGAQTGAFTITPSCGDPITINVEFTVTP